MFILAEVEFLYIYSIKLYRMFQCALSPEQKVVLSVPGGKGYKIQILKGADLVKT